MDIQLQDSEEQRMLRDSGDAGRSVISGFATSSIGNEAMRSSRRHFRDSVGELEGERE